MNNTVRAVAFKVTYNDGGAEPGRMIGYRGVCSDRIILDNIRRRRMTNCSAERSLCRQRCDENFIGKRPVSDGASWCYESALLDQAPLRFSAGFYHNGARRGEPIPMKQVEAGQLALLTTLPPEGEQAERFIFGMFRIGRVHPDEHGAITATSDGMMDVVLPDPVAKSLRFWNYYSNADGSRTWGSGLFRYLDSGATRRLIEDTLSLLSNHEARDRLYRALDGEFQPKQSLTSNAFGGCGEGLEHLRLKEYVASHPESIGLPADSAALIEFRYTSGDAVDIRFSLSDGTFAVVEIETIIPFPGAHQAIKYRALLEAELSLPLNSGRVRAILVAHEFDEATVQFAARYDIRLVAMKLSVRPPNKPMLLTADS